jgi:hypothetical protein
VTSSNTYERLIKAEMSATAVGTVTVARTTGPTTIRAIPIGERGFMAIFRKLASDPSSTKTFYGKLFVKNTNGSLALTVSTVTENSDPSGLITFALDTALDASTSSSNRVTAPSGPSGYSNGPANVPNSQNLSSGSAIGIWPKLDLAAGNAAVRSTWTPEIDGQTV